MISCCRFLDIRSFVPEVRSWSGNDVPVNLYQTNVILCPDKKGQGSKVQLSPSKAPVLANRRQSSAASSLRARSPDSAQLSSLREPGAHPNWPSGSSGRPKARRQGPTDCNPGRLPLLLGCRDKDGGEVHCCLKAWAKASGWPW